MPCVIIYTLKDIKQLKLWFKPRSYIHYGYRGNFHKDISKDSLHKKKNICHCDDLVKSIKSIFMVHNETTNIWSHMLFTIYLILYGFNIILYMDWTVEHKLIILIGTIGITYMVLMSTIYHIFRDQGKKTY